MRNLLSEWKKGAQARFETVGQGIVFPPAAEKAQEVPSQFLPECPYRLVFINGFYAPEHSKLPGELVALSLEEAARSYGVFLQHRMVRALKEETDPFTLLNAAFQTEGAFLYVPPHFSLKAPLEIHHFLSSSRMSSPRLYLHLAPHASIRLVQTVHSTLSDPFCNTFIDLNLDENSSCDLCSAQIYPTLARAYFSLRATLKRKARLRSHLLSHGAAACRSAFKVQLEQESSEVELLGLSQLRKTAQNEVHACVEHIAPSTHSRQHFRAVLYDQSLSRFEGKIYVCSTAQKTEAYQLSAHLPLGAEVRVHSKPNLEIFADDVKASHGAVVAEIGEEELFYLLSRGLSSQEARRWLIHGFCRELFDLIPLDSLKRVFSHA